MVFARWRYALNGWWNSQAAKSYRHLHLRCPGQLSRAGQALHRCIHRSWCTTDRVIKSIVWPFRNAVPGGLFAFISFLAWWDLVLYFAEEFTKFNRGKFIVCCRTFEFCDEGNLLLFISGWCAYCGFRWLVFRTHASRRWCPILCTGWAWPRSIDLFPWAIWSTMLSSPRWACLIWL